MKIAQLMEAKYQQDDKPEFTNLSNEQIFKKFMHLEPEMSEEGENMHFYTDKNIHIYDKGRDGSGEVNWVVVYPPGTTRERGHPNEETWYFVIDHDQDNEWQTNPQQWQISQLRILFDG